MNTKQRGSAQRGQHLAVWLSTKSAVIEFRCRGTPWGRKITTNNFGIREMSVEGLMSFFAQIYAWFMHHHSAQFGLIWTTITATAAMGMTLSIREETAPTSPKGTTPQLNLVPRRHIGALVTRHTNGTHRG